MLFVFACGFKHPCLALQHSVLISSGTDYLLARLVKSVHKLEAHKVLSKGLKNTSEVTNGVGASAGNSFTYFLGFLLRTIKVVK